MHRGYIKLWRCSVDNALYFSEPFTKWQAWQDLLIMTNHKPGTVTIRGIDVHLEAGEVLACDQFLADRWKWSRNKVRRYMARLSQKTEQQIELRKNNVCTIATVLNWKLYQANGTANETPNDTAEGQQKDTLKNDKHEKKDIYSAPTSSEDVPPAEIFLTFPTTGNPKQWHLTKSKLAEYESSFDTLDVKAQCKRALQWLKDNPAKRKTARGMTRFLGSWLSRAADSPATSKQSASESSATYTGPVL